MNRAFTLSVARYPAIVLQSISEQHLEELRNWKNNNRRFFFFQGIISPSDQQRWFQGYLSRPHDFMFVVVSDGRAIGCMGFRLLEGKIDIYNVILGLPEMGGRGLMSQAFHVMCSYGIERYSTSIQLKVLRSNPAKEWYTGNGFREMAAYDNYLELELDLATYKPCQFIETQSL